MTTPLEAKPATNTRCPDIVVHATNQMRHLISPSAKPARMAIVRSFASADGSACGAHLDLLTVDVSITGHSESVLEGSVLCDALKSARGRGAISHAMQRRP